MGAIGVMTGGGDCPGLNAVLRGVVAQATGVHGRDVIGFADGWLGVAEARATHLDRDAVRGILGRGGTILGTSRYDPYVHGEGLETLRAGLEAFDIERLIVIGGDGTLATALRLESEGLPVVGVPKTIDNDIAATDVTFGFHTAVQVATDAIDRLTTTAESHNRVILVEVMGRDTGWIALYSGLASGADVILIPEVPLTLDETADILKTRHDRGSRYSIVVVAEGFPNPDPQAEAPRDTYGFTRLGGVTNSIAPLLEQATGFETRVTVLGHVQRGGTPTAYDRVLATRFGVAAADLAVAGETRVMAAARGQAIVSVPLDDACASTRPVPAEMYKQARAFFG